MIRVLYILWLAKRHTVSWDEAMSNSEEIKLIPYPLLTYIWLEASVISQHKILLNRFFFLNS